MTGPVPSFGFNLGFNPAQIPLQKPLQYPLNPSGITSPTQQLTNPSLAPQVDLSAAPLDQSAGILNAITTILQMVTLLISGGGAGYSPYGLSTPTGLPLGGLAGGAAGLPLGGLAGGAAGLPLGGLAGGAAGLPPGGLAPQALSTSQNARLNNTLGALANDPEGARLLAAAQANGYTIEIGDPAAAAGGAFDKGNISCPHCQAALDAGQQINGVTLPAQRKIIINPNAPDFEKTVVHELVHAATPGDGNSQTEEGIADVIGYRVASRITGQFPPGSAASIFFNKITNYPGLNGSNPIRNTLASLGLNAGV